MVTEIIDLEMKVTKPIVIGKMTRPIIEGIILIKTVAKEIEIEVQAENMRGLGPCIGVP